jgi:hypothetical protein
MLVELTPNYPDQGEIYETYLCPFCGEYKEKVYLKDSETYPRHDNIAICVDCLQYSRSNDCIEEHGDDFAYPELIQLRKQGAITLHEYRKMVEYKKL